MWHGHAFPLAEEPTRDTGPGPTDRALRFELVAAAAMPGLEAPWTALAARALEPNPFFEPEVALPALAHLYGSRKPAFALVWRGDAQGRQTLAALLPLRVDRIFGFARAALHRYAPLGTPLIDRDDPAAPLACLLAGLAAAAPRAGGLILTELPTAGPVHALLQAHAAAQGAPMLRLRSYARAALQAETAGEGARRGSAKRWKNLRRQRRRLDDAGTVVFRSAAEPAAVRAALEAFLDLEAKGWKGRRRTALRSGRRSAAYARAMTERLAAAGRCRLDSLEVDGRPVAMGIVIAAADRAYFWKTAYDESLASVSPGVQLTLDLTRTQLAQPSVAITDSCATEDHPMINGVWRDRIELADILVPLRPSSPYAIAIERMRRAGRDLGRRLVAAVRRR
jgi:CelD/BcsL family acetyltransferase involved in cellulose biosynthesis